MQGQNAFNQFQTAGPMGFGGQNPNQQFNPQFQQFNTQQMQNPQMRQFQSMQGGQMNMGMMPNQMGNQMGGPGPNVNMQQQQPQPQNVTPPPKQRLIVKLENNERGFYSTMMSQLDPTDRGRVDSKEAVPFFKRSGLPVDVLKKIWIMTSSDNKTLDKEEFYAALRLVAYAQNNIEVSPNSIIQNLKVPLPKLQTPAKPAEPKPETPVNNPNPTGLDMGMGMGQPQDTLSNRPSTQSSFGGFPEPQAMGNFGAPSANPSFPGAGGMMGQGGMMGPGGNMGIGSAPSSSNFDLMGGGAQEDLLGGGGISNPPPVSQIQSDFANLSVQPTAPTTTTSFGGDLMSTNTNISPSPTNLASNNPQLGAVQTSSQGQLPEEPQSFSSDVLVDMTPEYVKQYETLFEHFDTTKKGIVTQEEIGETFLRSGLSNEVLFQIWSFCDTGDRGCLDKPEFMLALHLIAMSKKNIKLPATLPVKYEKFLKEYKRKLPAKDFLLEKTRQATEEQHNMSPSRQTMEHHQPSSPGMYGGGETAPVDNYDFGNQMHQNVDDYSQPLHNDVGNYHEEVHQPSYGGEPSYSGNANSDVLQKMQEHQNQLVAVSAQIRDGNNRALSDKKEEIMQLNAILQNCQNILQRLRSDNDYMQSEMVKLDNQKKNIQKSIESVQHQINDELVRQQGLHQNLRLGGTAQMPVQNVASFGSPGRANDDQFNVDFQKEFAGGWDGFDNNFGDQNQNPNFANNNNNNFGDFGF